MEIFSVYTPSCCRDVLSMLSNLHNELPNSVLIGLTNVGLVLYLVKI